MSPSIAAWLGSGGGTPTSKEQERAALAWRRITDKKTDVEFRKPDGTTLAPQRVRIEWDDGVSESESAAGRGPIRKVIVFGIKGHATLSNTDIKEGYRFTLDGDLLRCVDVIKTIGEVQAVFESSG